MEDGLMSNAFTVDWSSVPMPRDDGLATHLLGKSLPRVGLMSTDREMSFRILGKLDVAIEHVADWFATRGTRFA